MEKHTPPPTGYRIVNIWGNKYVPYCDSGTQFYPLGIACVTVDGESYADALADCEHAAVIEARNAK